MATELLEGGEIPSETTPDALDALAWGRFHEGRLVGKVLREAQQPAIPSQPSAAVGYSVPLLNEREKTHGDFGQQTTFVQAIKALLRSTPNWLKLSAAQKESLEMDASKTGRILYGDHNHKDSWEDKAGYAKLVAERL